MGVLNWVCRTQFHLNWNRVCKARFLIHEEQKITPRNSTHEETQNPWGKPKPTKTPMKNKKPKPQRQKKQTLNSEGSNDWTQAAKAGDDDGVWCFSLDLWVGFLMFLSLGFWVSLGLLSDLRERRSEEGKIVKSSSMD